VQSAEKHRDLTLDLGWEGETSGSAQDGENAPARPSCLPTQPPSLSAEVLLEEELHAMQSPMSPTVNQDHIATTRPPAYSGIVIGGFAVKEEVVAALDFDPRAERQGT
jgi:hypothetical protein